MGKDSERGLFLCGYCKEGMLSTLLSRDLLQWSTHTPMTPHLCSAREQLLSLNRSVSGIPPQFVAGTQEEWKTLFMSTAQDSWPQTHRKVGATMSSLRWSILTK